MGKREIKVRVSRKDVAKTVAMIMKISRVESVKVKYSRFEKIEELLDILPRPVRLMAVPLRRFLGWLDRDYALIIVHLDC